MTGRIGKEKRVGKDFVAVLSGVRSLHNVGSIFRTADGAGFSKIYLCGLTPSPLDRFGRWRPPLAKVSLGAEKTMPWEKSGSALRLIGKLKKEGYRIFALEQNKRAIPFYKSGSGAGSSGKKIALVVGSEVGGLPRPVLNRADKILEIPMAGKKESLNVAVAFGIAAYSLCRLAHRSD